MAQKVIEKHIIDNETLDNLIGSAKTADDLFGEDGLRSKAGQLADQIIH